jgi:hypothetical protein
MTETPETPDTQTEPPLRTCQNCGVEARTRFERCPSCHRSYFDRPRRDVRRRRTIAAVAGAVVVALLAVAGALAISNGHEDDAKARVRQQQRSVALRAKLKREQAPHRGAAVRLRPPRGATAAQRLAARRALVVAVQDRITADARARAKAGELDGPIAQTECGPILKSKTAIPDDRVLSKRVGRYDCVAVKHPIINGQGEKVASLGFSFVAALDFDHYTYTWCRNNPAQGEAGVSLVFVRLDRACLAATGKALGTGYVEAPGS